MVKTKAAEAAFVPMHTIMRVHQARNYAPGTCRAYGKSYILEVQSFMNLVRAVPVIFCSFACFVQSAVLCFFIFASSAFFCFAAALSVVAPAGAVVVGAGVCAKLTPRLRVVAKTAALSAYAMRDMGISES